MKFRMLLGTFLLIILTACSSTTQTVVTGEVIFYGEGEHWNVSYIYNSEMYDEKKLNWIEIEFKDFEAVLEDLGNLSIELESRNGLIKGIVGDMETEIEGNVVSFLVGTVNQETYEEDEFKMTIKSQDKQEVINLQKKQ
ncbi:MAG: hypothetical protein ACK4M9_16815 [Anaerobacillus sp.]|uniref:hypothetical protein n=1 Tax=Anaerobacillus sp. TaxID=1872506 RepID=UPI00391BE750